MAGFSCATDENDERLLSAFPSVAFLVHSFNRCSNVNSLASGLKRLDPDQLIVCDDGSIDGSREAWTSLLARSNEFLLMSNDLHEIRILDRAISFSSADIVCLVQDDDTIPPGKTWLEESLAAFRRHQDLAILGGFMGFHGFDTNPANVTRLWAELPFQFVEHVNIGPYFVRKSHYNSLGGWNYDFSSAGEPGICFDNELCLRAWINGYKVGYLFSPFKGPPGRYARDGGTDSFAPDQRRRNQLRNEDRILSSYGQHADRIAQLVRSANDVSRGSLMKS